ncbi:UPF0554 protein C2orf43-like protein [Escovopsis weberi]|uniref:UPF0554 protein C2orf43-like protein n=1 Tax=Escovopsis weberi TaxID=150374 RepID=A0A0M8MW91_ESCWE|nr:UPF0554 protein C2orf43-like protein [Escovopsis weberi]
MAPTTISLPAQRQRAPNATPYKKRVLIYFITGNPGLIGFYEVFLRSLRALIDEKPVNSETAYDIRGRNLFGFDDNEHGPFDDPESQPWDLEDQIQSVYEDVASQQWMSDDGQPRHYDYVYLMGHSLGAYISVEIMARHAREPVEPAAAHLHIPHAMLLFPTLTYLAKSPQGKKVTKLLRLLPSLPAQGQLLAKTMLTVFPPPALHFLLTRILGYSPQTARVTAQWLRSRDGVREAVYLGLSELQHIREETWDDDVWEVSKDDNQDNENLGAGAGGDKKPKVYIFFGKNDYWVANKWRDAFIENRRGGRTSIEVDTRDICHAFCLNEETSFLIAKKVRGWIDDTEKKRGNTSS